jgi:hypothetical protein
MSIEVAAQEFLFPPESDTIETEFIIGEVSNTNVTTEVPFFHNHLHDLESLWWVAVWVVFYNYISEGTPSRDHSSSAIQDALVVAGTLFPPALNIITRHNGFQLPTSFLRTCGRLPRNKEVICDGLNSLRRRLVKHYRLIEAGYPESVDPDLSKDDIYEDFTQVFTTLETDTHDLELDYIPDIYYELLKTENLSV